MKEGDHGTHVSTHVESRDRNRVRRKLRVANSESLEGEERRSRMISPILVCARQIPTL